jgi:hypothetical protein
MGRACSTNGEKRNSYRILVGKPEGKRPLGRPIRRWVDNIKMDHRDLLLKERIRLDITNRGDLRFNLTKLVLQMKPLAADIKHKDHINLDFIFTR